MKHKTPIWAAPATVWANGGSGISVTNFAVFAEVGSLQEGKHRRNDRQIIVNMVEIDFFFSKLEALVYDGVEILSGINH